VGKDPFDDGRSRLLTEEQRAYLGTWLREAGDLLALKDWRIECSPFDCEKSAYASTFIRDATDEATIAVGRDFLSHNGEEQRATLTHELLHPHFYRITHLAETLITAELGKRTEAVIDAAVEQLEELTIDRLAHAIAGWLPPVKMPARSET
jgi:hypothetical protein